MKKIILIASVLTAIAIFFAAVDIHITPASQYELAGGAGIQQVPASVIFDFGEEGGKIKVAADGTVMRFFSYTWTTISTAEQYCGSRIEVAESMSRVHKVAPNLVEIESFTGEKLQVNIEGAPEKEWNEGSIYHGKLNCNGGQKVLIQDR